MCDLAYVWLLELWQRQAMVDRQALLARGIVEDLPTFGTAQTQFDGALNADAVPSAHSSLSVEQLELRQALGVL